MSSELSVFQYGSKVLRKRAKPVVAITSALKKLADDMLEAMYKSNGIGLAAPQVGESIRLIVVDLAENEKRKPIILFNPVITATRGESLGEEGCEMRERGCCKESRGECEEKNEEVEKMGCCKKGVQKCEMKKDSVVVIKKK